ncbi:Translation initiation factor IF-2 [Bienertia sinuspersici]
MNRSFRGPESLMPSIRPRVPQLKSLHSSTTTTREKEDDLALFLEMRKLSESGNSPLFNIPPATAARKTGPDDFLNSDGEKNDYDWLLTPPGTPLFPSLDMDSRKAYMDEGEAPKAQPTALRSRAVKCSTGSNSSVSGLRRPSSAGGSGSRPPSSGGPGSRPPSSGGPGSRPLSSGGPGSRPVTPGGGSRPATPTGRPTTTSSRPSRSSTPTSRGLLPNLHFTLHQSPLVHQHQLVPQLLCHLPSLQAHQGPRLHQDPQNLQLHLLDHQDLLLLLGLLLDQQPQQGLLQDRQLQQLGPQLLLPDHIQDINSNSAYIDSVECCQCNCISKTSSAPSRNPVPSRGTSPTVRSRPWNPSEMPGFSLDAPPNLRTTLPDRPLSAARGRPASTLSTFCFCGAASNGRQRRQSCSPSRGRAPNGGVHSSGSSVPAVSRGHTKADDVSPVIIGKRWSRGMINILLVYLKSASSPDNSGFEGQFRRSPCDMAMRHMDIRRTIPGNLRPLMTKIPASSMYSVRSGPTGSRTASVSDSPLATSSNASSDQSVNNHVDMVVN